MRKVVLIIGLVLVVAGVQSQNYMISFAATGASNKVDSVKVENLTQCKDTIVVGSDVLNIVKEINELTKHQARCTIFPNPMTDYSDIEFDSPLAGHVNIAIYDITGKEIIRTANRLDKGSHTYRISGLSSGVYTISVNSEAYAYTWKLISTNTDKNLRGLSGGLSKRNNLKSSKSTTDLPYKAGDLLKLTGKSGIYRTVVMLTPTKDTTVTFDFVACTDADSNNYSVVKIGTQLWMAENLNVGKYVQSTETSNSHSDVSDNGIIEKYCNENDEKNCEIYGGLYDWDEMMQYDTIEKAKGICPTGWHIPSDGEWTILTDFLGVWYEAGGKIKETCSNLWYIANAGATNESGFTLLPGAFRFDSGTFDAQGDSAYLWSSSQYDSSLAWYRYVYYDYAYVDREFNFKTSGFSVRCVKD